MLVIAEVVLGIGAIGTCGSVVAELKTNKDVFEKAMRLSIAVFGLGGILMGIAAMTG